MAKHLAILVLLAFSTLVVGGVDPCCAKTAVAQSDHSGKPLAPDHGADCVSCLQCGHVVGPSLETPRIGAFVAASSWVPPLSDSLLPSPALAGLHRPPISRA